MSNMEVAEPSIATGGVNSQFLIHVGVEVVVIGGVFFYLNKQNSLLREEVESLRDKLTKCEEAISHQNQILRQHDQILQSMLGGHQVPVHSQPPPKPEEPDVSDEQLDDILKSELETIKEGRYSPPTSECEGDSCPIDIPERKKKSRNTS